jgi:imidazoleglycerol phosphate synthase glutamine amidotransferase subunit HisH
VHGGAARDRSGSTWLHDAVASGRPFLGICVGMQMLYDDSEEDPADRRAWA